ncbi:teichoic acid export ATP-binding protein TagH [Halalkalibacter wakoensis JCM 9140]|uniref:Teichoic acid export ATP-binding protein TagH n=1 Tax=Halalkalibacter wakoensis JCM 9140 TaxID=1236970 RepID=W4Q4G4_9BACI|nr:teichoic acid export ATP-binding protein TagH [Halalkalibacter wakoensis JCM 9140]
MQPDIFIIDEALSAGDIDFRQKASERIQEMIESAKVVIIVSHSMGFVEKVCSRVLWLDNGELYMDCLPKETVKKYKQKISAQ